MTPQERDLIIQTMVREAATSPQRGKPPSLTMSSTASATQSLVTASRQSSGSPMLTKA